MACNAKGTTEGGGPANAEGCVCGTASLAALSESHLNWNFGSRRTDARVEACHDCSVALAVGQSKTIQQQAAEITTSYNGSIFYSSLLPSDTSTALLSNCQNRQVSLTTKSTAMSTRSTLTVTAPTPAATPASSMSFGVLTIPSQAFVATTTSSGLSGTSTASATSSDVMIPTARTSSGRRGKGASSMCDGWRTGVVAVLFVGLGVWLVGK